jgi:hypothetical protein
MNMNAITEDIMTITQDTGVMVMEGTGEMAEVAEVVEAVEEMEMETAMAVEEIKDIKNHGYIQLS